MSLHEYYHYEYMELHIITYNYFNSADIINMKISNRKNVRHKTKMKVIQSIT